MESNFSTDKISDLSKNQLLERASKLIFSTGINDATSELCRANMKYGLAQMHLIQEKYGFEPKAFFISSPDETISRNKYRWNSGYGYGGKINWGSGKDKIIFLNTKPNHCGILVGGLWEAPDSYEIIKNIDSIKNKKLYIDDILIDWDFGISNHFISCFKTENLLEEDLPPYIFLIHGSAPELREDKYGMGVYIDKSQNLKDLAIKEYTILGEQYILLDSDADDYLRLNMKALKFSKEKREIITEKIFKDNYKIICNQPHQFLKDYNNIYLGTNCTDIKSEAIDSNIFPIALRADLPAYLFKGKLNLSLKTINDLNFMGRAENYEILEELQRSNILPHGAGYAFPDIKHVIDVLEYKDQRYFVCKLKKGNNRLKIIRVVSDLQFEYRKSNIILKTIQTDLGQMIAILRPIFSLKL